jgi:hypothetical protein
MRCTEHSPGARGGGAAFLLVALSCVGLGACVCVGVRVNADLGRVGVRVNDGVAGVLVGPSTDGGVPVRRGNEVVAVSGRTRRVRGIYRLGG